MTLIDFEKESAFIRIISVTRVPPFTFPHMSRRRRNETSDATTAPFRQLRSPWPPLDVLTPDDLARIHNASMQILENTGIELLDGEALEIFRKAGAKVDVGARRVWPDRDFLMGAVSKAPSSFTLHARNPAKSVVIGGDHIVFGPVGGQAYSTNYERGRRPGTLADLEELLKLVHCFNILHHGSDTLVEPTDLPAHTRHLDSTFAAFRLTDKTIMGHSRGRTVANDCIELVATAFGGLEAAQNKPVLIGIINVNSPLRYDDWMLGGLITYARAGQPCAITPFIAAGAMGPITIAGAIAQQNAEALVGIALTQLINPGAPVLYGNFTVDAHMRSGSPSFGTPEGAWATLAAGQLARHYKLPFRGNGSLSSSNVPDAQAAYETMMSLWPAILARTNFVYQGAGWAEGGLTTSYEKFIIDVECLAMMEALLHGCEVSDESLALPFINQVGPGGHHFDTEHTLSRYSTAFYNPIVSTRLQYANWVEAGSLDAAKRAHAKWIEALRNYEEPKLDEGVCEAMREFAAKRKAEIGERALTP
ncbi:MAG: trimethylamine methyltransferase family protein [Chloroflexi bacterium]|nr:trimethylamine methyltransferase family protein [Chloroflexota bacterium]